MSNNNVQTLRQPEQPADDPLTSLLQKGARQLIAQAVEAELQAYLEQHSDLRHEGKAAIIRNGYLPEREIQTGIGSVPVKVPKVRDRSGNGNKFNSMLVPPYLKRTGSLEELLPWLYLKGISTGDFQEALQALLGPKAENLSAGVKKPAGLTTTGSGVNAALRQSITCTSGLMAFTSIYALKKVASVFWY